MFATISHTPPFTFLNALKRQKIAPKPITPVAKSISSACPDKVGKICVPCDRAMSALTMRAKNTILTYCPTSAVSLFLKLDVRYFIPVFDAPEKIAPPMAAMIPRFMFRVVIKIYCVVVFWSVFSIASFCAKVLYRSFAVFILLFLYFAMVSFAHSLLSTQKVSSSPHKSVTVI